MGPLPTRDMRQAELALASSRKVESPFFSTKRPTNNSSTPVVGHGETLASLAPLRFCREPEQLVVNAIQQE